MGQLAGFHQNLEICATAAQFVEKCVSWFQPIVVSGDGPPFRL